MFEVCFAEIRLCGMFPMFMYLSYELKVLFDEELS